MKYKMYRYTAIGILTWIATATGAVAAGDAGDILYLSVDAKAAALGKSVVSSVEDSTSVFWNPAGLGAVKRQEVSTSIYQYLGWNFQALFLAGNWQGIGLGMGYVASSIDGIQESVIGGNGRGLDTGKSFDETQRVWLAGASVLVPWVDKMRVGTTIKYITHSLYNYAAAGWGMDVGLQGEIPNNEEPENAAKWGVQVLNAIRPTMEWNTLSKTKETAQMVIRPGISIPFLKRSLWLHTQLDLQSKTNELQFGGDYWITPSMIFRAGYANRHIAFGTGLCFKDFSMDFSWEESGLDAAMELYKLSMRYCW